MLVVDDDPQLRAMLADTLRRDGFAVEEAPDGEAALRLLGERPPALVLLDVLMPGLDGIETCRRIRARSEVPIILLTALGRDEDIELGLAAGANDYCRKPVGLAELRARVRARLRRRVPPGLLGTNGLMDVRDYCQERIAEIHARPGRGDVKDRVQLVVVLSYFALRNPSAATFADGLRRLAQEADREGRRTLARAARAVLRDWQQRREPDEGARVDERSTQQAD